MSLKILRAVKSSISALLTTFSKSTQVANSIQKTVALQHGATSVIPRLFLRRTNFLYFSPNNVAIRDIRRRACIDFIKQRSTRLSLLSFIAFSMTDTKEHNIVTSCHKVYQETFQSSLFKVEHGVTDAPTKFSSYDHVERLGKQTCNGAVYAAKHKLKEYAIKIMFNIYESSNGDYIAKKFEKEYKLLCQDKNVKRSDDVVVQHPNIIAIHKVFVDDTPLLPDSNTYEACLPARFTKNGCGRNKTLFLVMPRYECNLTEYLQQPLSFDQRLCLFLQLTNSIGHLERFKIAHQDIKCDNVLLDFTGNSKYPRLILSDFGECFSNGKDMLCYDRNTIGGNLMNMAPEVKEICFNESTDQPVNYSKADAWSCGKIGLSLFYQDNFGSKEPGNSSWLLVSQVISMLLTENPAHRISAYQASVMLFMIRFTPNLLVDESSLLLIRTIVQRWLLKLSIRTYNMAQVTASKCSLQDLQLTEVFLSRTNVEDVQNCVALLKSSVAQSQVVCS